MKRFKYLALVLLLICSLSSCKQNDFMLFDDVARIQFGPDYTRIYTPSYNLVDTVKRYSFYYEPVSVTQDTVFFDIYAIGGICDYDRPFKLQQVMIPGAENAIEGVHYKSFSAQDMAKHYVIPKDSVHIQVPVVLLRADLKQLVVKLQFAVVANEHFQTGEPNALWRRVEFTADLQRPQNWDSYVSKYFFGQYSRTKHLFMIEKTGEKWDAEFFTSVMADYSELIYWQEKMIELLIVENQKRKEANNGIDDPMKDENNELISFSY